MDGGSPRGKTNAGVTDTGRKITTQQLTMLGKKRHPKLREIHTVVGKRKEEGQNDTS